MKDCKHNQTSSWLRVLSLISTVIWGEIVLYLKAFVYRIEYLAAFLAVLVNYMKATPLPHQVTNHKVQIFQKGSWGQNSPWLRTTALVGKNTSVLIMCVCVCLVPQSSPTLYDSMDCSPLGSSVHGIFQARILEWVAISFSRASSWCRDQTHISCISCIGRQILYHWTTWGERCPY